jgi:hypothetical protein
MIFERISLKESITIEILHEKFESVHHTLKQLLYKSILNLSDIDLDSHLNYEFYEKNTLTEYFLPEFNVIFAAN